MVKAFSLHKVVVVVVVIEIVVVIVINKEINS